MHLFLDLAQVHLLGYSIVPCLFIDWKNVACSLWSVAMLAAL